MLSQALQQLEWRWHALLQLSTQLAAALWWWGKGQVGYWYLLASVGMKALVVGIVSMQRLDDTRLVREMVTYSVDKPRSRIERCVQTYLRMDNERAVAGKNRGKSDQVHYYRCRRQKDKPLWMRKTRRSIYPLGVPFPHVCSLANRQRLRILRHFLSVGHSKVGQFPPQRCHMDAVESEPASNHAVGDKSAKYLATNPTNHPSGRIARC